MLPSPQPSPAFPSLSFPHSSLSLPPLLLLGLEAAPQGSLVGAALPSYCLIPLLPFAPPPLHPLPVHSHSLLWLIPLCIPPPLLCSVWPPTVSCGSSPLCLCPVLLFSCAACASHSLLSQNFPGLQSSLFDLLLERTAGTAPLDVVEKGTPQSTAHAMQESPGALQNPLQPPRPPLESHTSLCNPLEYPSYPLESRRSPFSWLLI